MINGETVQKTCLEIGRYTDEQMAIEFDRFFRTQPGICEFIVEATHESGQKIQELSLLLGFMVFKSLEASGQGQVRTIKPEDIETAYKETEFWMTRLSLAGDDELQETIEASLDRDTEPHLLQYVISELSEPLENSAELSDEEKGEVLIVLKTVISSFCGPELQKERH